MEITFILNILIDVCTIFAVWQLSKLPPPRIILKTKTVMPVIKPLKIAPDLEKYYRICKIAEKTADRAFSMASSANLGVVALQQALRVPRLMTKQQGLQNKTAKSAVNELFGGELDPAKFDWLYPALNEEERDVIDKARDHLEKHPMENGK